MLRRVLASSVLFVAAAVAVTGSVAPRASQAQDAVAKQIVALEDAWAVGQTKHDPVSVGALLAEDCVFAQPDGTLQGKAKILESIKSGQEFVSIVNHDNKVTVHGGTAMVTGLWTETVKGPKGNVATTYRYTDTWMKQAGGTWLYIGGQSTQLK